jgi:hypothetical protein
MLECGIAHRVQTFALWLGLQLLPADLQGAVQRISEGRHITGQCFRPDDDSM